MLIRCGLLLALLSCVRTREDFHRDGLLGGLDSDFNRRFSLWPSVHNAATLLRIRRESQTVQSQAVETPVAAAADVQGPSEGVNVKLPPTDHAQTVQTPLKDTTVNISKETPPAESSNAQAKDTSNLSNKTPKGIVPEETPPSVVAPTAVTIKDNGTNADKAAKQWDFSNPEATKRGLIVFGGFALLAMAYFIFYRTKSKYNEASNPNNTNESNQFRYGVLESDDRRDNLELSRVPLTMESDEEEDDDLEIFDLEQKKKSLSYVNLQANDEDIVLSPRYRNERDDLLLDIEDGNSDVLINWSNNGNKSIL